MALVTCSECTGKVSDQASACPHCGAPVKVDDSVAKHVNIESTSRPISTTREGGKYEALGFLAIVVGMFFAIASDGAWGTVGGILMFAGFGSFLVGRFM